MNEATLAVVQDGVDLNSNQMLVTHANLGVGGGGKGEGQKREED